MLQPFFKWMESLAVYRSSIYLGPGVNLVHLVSMVTFMGALLMVWNLWQTINAKQVEPAAAAALVPAE